MASPLSDILCVLLPSMARELDDSGDRLGTFRRCHLHKTNFDHRRAWTATTSRIT